jgi:hypothetical protein
MGKVMRSLRGAVAAAWMLTLISCGGGDGSSSGAASGSTSPATAAPNVASVIVDGGPTASSPSINTLFTSVTLCVPGSTTQCQTIDHIQVDTGSYGLRVLAPVLALSLPLTKASDGSALVECTQFVDGYSWGPVALADVQVSGETAASVPIQVIGDTNFVTVPNDCSSPNPNAEDTVATFGANGILGIGVFEQDCAGCDSNAANGFYYSCPQTGDCLGTTVPIADQVANPVPLFATDNNGTIIDLPSVAAPGEATMTGSLIFGIDTRTNNASGTQSVLTVDGNGNFTIVFNGQTFNASFIDSGTNGIFFSDSALPTCTESSFSGFYCPSSTQNFSATLTGLNAVSVTEAFSVENAENVASGNPTYTVLPALGGTYSNSADTFDWGLPFYYGRRVATAIENHTTAVNTGPYIAF